MGWPKKKTSLVVTSNELKLAEDLNNESAMGHQPVQWIKRIIFCCKTADVGCNAEES